MKYAPTMSSSNLNRQLVTCHSCSDLSRLASAMRPDVKVLEKMDDSLTADFVHQVKENLCESLLRQYGPQAYSPPKEPATCFIDLAFRYTSYLVTLIQTLWAAQLFTFLLSQRAMIFLKGMQGHIAHKDPIHCTSLCQARARL